MTTRLHQLLDAHAATRPDQRMARDHDGRDVTWAGLREAAEAAAAALRARDVRPGDRVMIVAENCVALAALLFACSRLGAWAVLVNARAAAPELARIAADARPRVRAHTTGVSDDAGAHAAAAGADRLSLPGLGDVALTNPAPADPEPLREDAGQVAALLYTTGTTGTPKGVMLTHGNLLFAGRVSADMRAMVPRDVVYGALPLTHVYGLASMLTAVATVGAQLWLEPRFRADGLMAAIESGVTIVPAVPQMHAMLVDHARGRGIDRLADVALRFVSSGGAPLDPELRRRAERFYGLALQNGYGMTEATAGITVTRSALGCTDTSVGVPFPGVELRLDIPEGAEDGVGEILTRGPHVMAGYYRNPAETAAVMTPDGFLRSGDLGRLDAEGRLHVVGRRKELIIRSGFNVYPVEVEAALTEHPAVIQSAVVGRKLPDGNEEVVAFVLTAGGATVSEAELRAHVGPRLSPYKRPGAYVVATELPATPTGKILKHRLLEVFADRLPAAGMGAGGA
ncbi:MAG: class I adenylate-forming enzyme family protein [Alkalilacustris sp.]